MKKKAGVSTVDGAISALQALVGRPSALFDPYAVIAALEEVVSLAQKVNDQRAMRFNTILRKCRPLVNEACLQAVLTKLVANKEEAEISKAIDKAMRQGSHLHQPNRFPLAVSGFPNSRWPIAGRTGPAPPYRRFRNRGQRKCFICNQEGHIARYCPNNSQKQNK